MLRETLEIMGGRLPDGSPAVFVDATLGAGGHASALLERFPESSLVGLDQDEMARSIAEERLSPYEKRARVRGWNFRDISLLGGEPGWSGADGVLFDLGVSNMQLATPERGFSFQEDGPLDMRMDKSADIKTAAEILESGDARELAAVFREYGEERYAFQIARAIVWRRERGGRIETTSDLTNLIRATLPAPVQRKMGTHPARRVFQALRIAVNSELEALSEGLEGAIEITRSGGVIVVISYHSLEDRIVKRTFLGWAQGKRGRILTRRPMTPSGEETGENRSSRSAKLRAFEINTCS
jgi:16S rRNA (cytosine1402-N4)-methyltransferase